MESSDMDENYSDKSDEQNKSQNPDETEDFDLDALQCDYLDDDFTNTECSMCHKSFETTSALKDHIADEHLNKRCPNCEKRFYSVPQLRKHLRGAHLESMQLKCSFCNAIFKTKYNLQQHLFTHSKQPTFECSHADCDKNFWHINSLKQHERVHENRNRRNCPICKQSVTRLSSHILTHNDSRPFGCDLCDRRYLTEQQLSRHKTAHSGLRFKCEVCDLGYKNMSSLYKHRRSAHLVDKHTCPFCKKVYNRRDNMTSHAKRVHGEILFNTNRAKPVKTNSVAEATVFEER